MFCHNCGKNISNEANFCHSCGEKRMIVSVTKNLPDNTRSQKIKDMPIEKESSDVKLQQPETRESFMARTNIKSVAEATGYLRKLKGLFWLIFISSALVRSLSEAGSGIFSLMFLVHIGLLIYFIYFCVKVLKAENLPKSNAIWSVVFAPISWFYFYPLIANPLKIITGTIEPPNPLTGDEKKQRKIESDKKFWRRIKIGTGIFLTIFIIALVAIIFSN